MASPRQGHIAIHIAGSDSVLIAAGTARGRAVESAEFFVLSRNAFEQATEAASGGEDAGPTITIGMLEPDASVRREKRYRTSGPTQH